MSKSSRLVSLLALGLGCVAHKTDIRPLPDGALRADSMHYSVRVNGPVYEATMGFAFHNTSGRVLSKSQCRTPSPPALQKQLADGSWIHAYSPVELMPPFTLALE
jgi:hypothetical protein